MALCARRLFKCFCTIAAIWSLYFTGSSSVTVSITTDPPCQHAVYNSKIIINDGSMGSIFCNFEGKSVGSGTFKRTVGGTPEDILEFTSTVGTPDGDLVGRVVATVNNTGINLEYSSFDDATEDGAIITCQIVTDDTFETFTNDLLEICILEDSSPTITVDTMSYSQDEPNVITGDVTLVATASASGNCGDLPVVMTASQDGTPLTCESSTACSNLIPKSSLDCGVTTTTVTFVTTLFCDTKTTSVEFTCEDIITTSTTEAPACDCCTYANGLFIGPGCIVPISQLVVLIILCLIWTGVICATCQCVKKCSRKSRLWQLKIQSVIHAIMITFVLACLIAIAVCYGKNQDQPAYCNCKDETPVHMVIVPTVILTFYITGLILAILCVPKHLPEGIDESCGGNSSRNNERENASEVKHHDLPKGVTVRDPMTPRKLPPIGQKH